jgi:hypothetical protein
MGLSRQLTDNPVFQPAMRVEKSICALEKVLSFTDQARPGGAERSRMACLLDVGRPVDRQRVHSKSRASGSLRCISDRHRLKDYARIVVLGDEVHVQIF